MDFEILFTVFDSIIEQNIENLENILFGQLMNKGTGEASVTDFTREFRGEHLDALLNFGIEIDAFDGAFS